MAATKRTFSLFLFLVCLGNTPALGRFPLDPEPPVRKKEALRVIDDLNGKDSLILSGAYEKVVFKGINGEAQVDCAADFTADEIYIEALNGSARVRLKLASKATVKTLTVVRINGAIVLDADQLDAEQIQIKEMNGDARVTLQARGDVVIEDINGSPRLTVRRCRHFTAKQPVKGSATLNVTHGGKASVIRGSRGVTLQLRPSEPRPQ